MNLSEEKSNRDLERNSRYNRKESVGSSDDEDVDGLKNCGLAEKMKITTAEPEEDPVEEVTPKQEAPTEEPLDITESPELVPVENKPTISLLAEGNLNDPMDALDAADAAELGIQNAPDGEPLGELGSFIGVSQLIVEDKTAEEEEEDLDEEAEADEVLEPSPLVEIERTDSIPEAKSDSVEEDKDDVVGDVAKEDDKTATNPEEILQPHTGFQLGISEHKGEKKSKEGEKMKESKSGGTQKVRYFVVRSSNHQNVTSSVERGVWATTHRNRDKFNKAFRESDSVILIFSVIKSKMFQGYARMDSEISMSKTTSSSDNWVVESASAGLTESFKVTWLKLFDLPIHHTNHLINMYNEGTPAFYSRDGQELDPACGEALCKMIDEGAAREEDPVVGASTTSTGQQSIPGAGATADSSTASHDGNSSSLEDSRKRARPGPTTESGVCFQFHQFGRCNYGDQCKYPHPQTQQQLQDPRQMTQNSTYPYQARSGPLLDHTAYAYSAASAMQMQMQAQHNMQARQHQRDPGVDPSKQRTPEEEDITNMTYEEYVAKKQRLMVQKQMRSYPQSAAAAAAAAQAQAQSTYQYAYAAAAQAQAQMYPGTLTGSAYPAYARNPLHDYYAAAAAAQNWNAWGASPYQQQPPAYGGYPFGY